jgi:predicted TIM-barrel fold metal-dependent hydrolase
MEGGKMKKLYMILPLPLILCFFIACQSQTDKTANETSAVQRPPIIDVHFHAYTAWEGEEVWDWLPQDISYPRTNEELLKKTLEVFDRNNIVKIMACGGDLEMWQQAAPGRIIRGVQTGIREDPEHVNKIRKAFESGEYEVLGEFFIQPGGREPFHPMAEPYWALAEKLDVPVGVHMGPGPPAPVHAFWRNYRVSMGNPLLLEDVLIKHPKLRVYVMHAGWPFRDEMIGLLLTYPNVYIDISALNFDWMIPQKEFHSYLKRLIDARCGDRIMFGSDHCWSPDDIEAAIKGVELATFLTEEQKRDIFYNNAVRFFRLDDELQ